MANTADPIPAASYARISEKKERDKVADQHRQNEAHAAARGYRIVARFEDDGISALGSKERPGFEAMLSAAQEGNFKAIVATEEERLARNVEEKLELHAACEDFGIVFDTIRDGFVDPSTDSGEFMSTVRAAMGRIESKRKARRQRANNAELVADGLPVPGKRRYGFEQGNRVERKDEADRVRWAFAQIAAGKSLRSVATAFEKSPTAMRDLLRNPSYAGWVVRLGVRYEAAPEIARVVDRKTWQVVQDLLSDESRRTSPGPSRKHFLSGVARCECGKPVRAMSVYYTCSTGNGSHATIYKADVEPLVKERLAAVLFDYYEDDQPELGPLAAKLAGLEAERTRWTAMGALPGADLALIGKELVRIEGEAKKASEELSRSRVADTTAELAERAREALLAMSNHHALDMTRWAEYFDALDVDERRTLVDSKLSVVIAKGRGLSRVTITPR